MTAQVGNAGTSAFNNSAMASPSILSLFGASGNLEPIAVMALGRLSGANAAAGTLDLLLDTSDQATDIQAQPFAAQSYAVATNGRGTLSVTDSPTRSFAYYLDGVANGYIVEHGSTAGNAGLLEAQFQGPYRVPPATGTFPATLPTPSSATRRFRRRRARSRSTRCCI